MRTLFRILSILATAKAAKKGPGALARREARRHAHRTVRRLFR